jgi:hypothetical protein
MFSSLLDIKATEFQSGVLSHCVEAVKAFPKPSLPALTDLLRDGWRPFERYIPESERDYFIRPGIDGKTSDFDNRDTQARREELRRRIDRLSNAVPALRRTFTSTKTKVDLRYLIDGANIIIVNAKTSILGDTGSEFFQRLWTMLLLDAARRRLSYSIPCFCYLDEAHKGIAKDIKIADILDECRSAKIAIVIAHQGKSQIEERKVLASLERRAIKLEHRKPLEQGQFYASVRSLPQDEVVLTTARAPRLPELSNADRHALRERMRQLYSMDPAPVRAAPPQPQPEPVAAVDPAVIGTKASKDW